MIRLQTAHTAICKGDQNIGVMSKGFQTSLMGSNIEAVKLSFRGWFERGRKSKKFFQVGSPPVSLQCTTSFNLLFPTIIVTMGLL